MKIVINKDYGGFELSTQAFERLIELGMTVTTFEKGHVKNSTADIIKHPSEIYGDYSFVKDKDEIRSNPLVVQVVEELKERANGRHAKLGIVEIPDGVVWSIEEYDGVEWVSENHRTWS